MIRTIIWFIWFALSLIISIPFMFRVKYLINKNKTILEIIFQDSFIFILKEP